MKRLYFASKYAKYLEQYCGQHFPDKKDELCARSEHCYAEFLKQMPDLGGKANSMAANMEDWFTILSFYEASGHAIGGEALLKIKQAEAERLRFLSRLIDGNRSKWAYRVFKNITAVMKSSSVGIRKKASGWTAGRSRLTRTAAQRASAFIWWAAPLRVTRRNTATGNCCPGCVKPIIFLRSCCTHA